MVYADRKISGTRRDRADYNRLLRDAEARKFNLLVLWDLKRLSRAEDLPQVLARFRFWNIRIVTCDGFDSAQEGSDVRGWVDGMMGNRYLHDLAKATHRGLTGRALAGASAGGLAYGYRVAGTGRREVDPQQATIVRRIFAEYLAGDSALVIAERLNLEGVPAPRGDSWMRSAIHGDQRRGIGILTNPIYAGRQVWNRSCWKKNPDTGRRHRIERPESEWIVHDVPHLAIVDVDVWTRAQARLQSRKINMPKRADRATYLLSGILRCGGCGGPMVAIDRYRYGCVTRKERGKGVCPLDVAFPRAHADQAMLDAIRGRLLSAEAFDEFKRQVAQLLKLAAPNLQEHEQSLRQAERERDNLLNAIRAGINVPSLKTAMEEAEYAVERAHQSLEAAKAFEPAQILPRAKATWERLVRTLGEGKSLEASREALKEILGDSVTVNKKGRNIVAEVPASPLIQHCQIKMVAGARYIQHLTMLVELAVNRCETGILPANDADCKSIPVSALRETA